jgi:hypothetical protein
MGPRPARVESFVAGISRRDFLRRSGALAFGAAAGSLGPLELLACETAQSDSLRKCISLGGPGPLRQDNHPDDYRLWGNREYIRDVSGTKWVKFWVSWLDLQQELDSPPSSMGESWKHLNGAPGGESWLRRLDRQVKAVNDDGLGVIVTLFHASPTWSSGATGPDPVSRVKPAEQKLPKDLSPDGPWGWFIGHLCARYKKGAPRNPDGPSAPAGGGGRPGDANAGNPDGGWIDVLEICNEPNLLCWPQENIDRAVVEMVRSAERLSARLGGQAILAPATSDFPDRDHRNARGLTATEWRGFTERVLDGLSGFSPAVDVYWSQHNFSDVKRPTAPSRAESVVRLLRARKWPSQDRGPLWLTEGGFNMYPNQRDPRMRARQAKLIEANYRRMKDAPGLFMWTQHTICDKDGNDFKSGLRDEFIEGVGPGPKRPSWRAWKELPGSSTA